MPCLNHHQFSCIRMEEGLCEPKPLSVSLCCLDTRVEGSPRDVHRSDSLSPTIAEKLASDYGTMVNMRLEALDIMKPSLLPYKRKPGTSLNEFADCA